MSGYRSKFFRHHCPQHGCYVQQLPSWDDLIECFPRGIRPTDIDGMVEINDHFLFLEEKCAGKGPDEGQRRALQRLASRSGVMVVFFRPGRASDLEVLTFPAPSGWEPMTRADFHARITTWALTADGATIRE